MTRVSPDRVSLGSVSMAPMSAARRAGPGRHTGFGGSGRREGAL
ncbi:hypothetical protein WEI85_10055 [Actinomycetes bacterium KLBMP 9797]